VLTTFITTCSRLRNVGSSPRVLHVIITSLTSSSLHRFRGWIHVTLQHSRHCSISHM
jgi:hypothetical protein